MLLKWFLKNTEYLLFSHIYTNHLQKYFFRNQPNAHFNLFLMSFLALTSSIFNFFKILRFLFSIKFPRMNIFLVLRWIKSSIRNPMEDFEIFLLQYFFLSENTATSFGQLAQFQYWSPLRHNVEINLCSSNENYEKAFQAINKNAKFWKTQMW